MQTVRRSGVSAVLRQRLAADLAFQAAGVAFVAGAGVPQAGARLTGQQFTFNLASH